ncbi:MAG: hypothetical protein ACFFE8_08720 [Candidatus Heimdallarchaeota archaeon]
MENPPPPGVLIGVEKTRERCGICNQPFTKETYFDTLTEQRSYRYLCETCKLVIPVEGDLY